MKLLGGRVAAAVMGLFMLGVGSSASAQSAGAQVAAGLDVAAAVRSIEVDASARPLGKVAPVASTVATASASGAVFQAQPARSVTITRSVEAEAAWLRSAGWQLYALVDRFSAGAPLSDEANCIAVAVYHEARGETLDGQLAVARVIMNRARSGKYPASWCGVVKQPWQFSFVNPRTGSYPAVDEGSASWRKALGVTRLAIANAVPSVGEDVLWYHATYVAPSWGRRLTFAQRIGTHIFYRA